MESPVYKKFFPVGFILSFFANILIIVALTQLIRFSSETEEKTFYRSVEIADFKPSTPVKKKIIEKKKEEIQKKEKKIIKHKTKQFLSETMDLNMDLPDVELNPNIKGSNFSIPAMQPVGEVTPQFDSSKVFDMNNLDIAPVQKFKRNPVYPYRAKRLGIEGEVSISFIVDQNGKVSNIKILKAVPEKIFDKSVLDAVSSWEYAPGELGGQHVRTRVTTKIVFDLEDE